MDDHSHTQTLEFYDYGPPILIFSAISTLNLAITAALAHNDDDLIGTENIQMSSEGVQIRLRPGKDMTWRMWLHALWGMKHFVRRDKMSYRWSFTVLEEGWGDVGMGMLSSGLESLSNGTQTGRMS